MNTHELIQRIKSHPANAFTKDEIINIIIQFDNPLPTVEELDEIVSKTLESIDLEEFTFVDQSNIILEIEDTDIVITNETECVEVKEDDLYSTIKESLMKSISVDKSILNEALDGIDLASNIFVDSIEAEFAIHNHNSIDIQHISESVSFNYSFSYNLASAIRNELEIKFDL